MEKEYTCICCDEDHRIYIDPDDGDTQELTADCSSCGSHLNIVVNFNYPTGCYDIDVTQVASR